MFPVAWIYKKEETISASGVEVGSCSYFGVWISSLETHTDSSLFRDSLSPVVNILANGELLSQLCTDYSTIESLHKPIGAGLMFMLNNACSQGESNKAATIWVSLISSIVYTASSIEIGMRDSPDTSAKECMSDNSLSTLRLLCEFGLTYSYASHISQSPTIKSHLLSRRVFGGLSAEELTGRKWLPVLQEDAFALFVESSLVILPKGPGGKFEVLKWVRLFYLLNVMQTLCKHFVNDASEQSEVKPEAVLPEAKAFFDWFICRMGFTGTGIYFIIKN